MYEKVIMRAFILSLYHMKHKNGHVWKRKWVSLDSVFGRHIIMDVLTLRSGETEFL